MQMETEAISLLLLYKIPFLLIDEWRFVET
jgi:hypothetical protein